MRILGVGVRPLVADLEEGELVAEVGAGAGRFPTFPTRVAKRRDALGSRARRNHLVEGGDGVAGADLARVHPVVAEVLAGQHPGLVADQPVLAHRGRVELHLDLHVLRDGEEHRGGLVDEGLAGFVQAVDVGGVAVAVLGEALHERVVVVAHAEPEHGEEHPALALAGDEALELVRIGDPDVEVTVRREDHPVDPALHEVPLGEKVCLPDPLRAGRRTARVEVFEGGEDPSPLGHRGRWEHGAGRARVDHDRDRVLGGESAEQELEGADDEGELVRLVHRPRGVDEEDEVRAGRRPRVEGVALDADVHQPGGGVPGRGHERDAGRERGLAALGAGVVVGEVVDELLDPHRVRLRQHPAVEGRAHEAVGGGVCVDRERGDRLLGDHLDGVGVEARELVAPLLPVVVGIRFGLHGRKFVAFPVLRHRFPRPGRHGQRAEPSCKGRGGRLGARMCLPRPPALQRLGARSFGQRPEDLRLGFGCGLGIRHAGHGGFLGRSAHRRLFVAPACLPSRVFRRGHCRLDEHGFVPSSLPLAGARGGEGGIGRPGLRRADARGREGEVRRQGGRRRRQVEDEAGEQGEARDSGDGEGGA